MSHREYHKLDIKIEKMNIKREIYYIKVCAESMKKINNLKMQCVYAHKAMLKKNCITFILFWVKQFGFTKQK